MDWGARTSLKGRDRLQQQLSDQASVPQSTISLLEWGKQTRVDFSTLDHLAFALGSEPGELLEREGAGKRKRAR